MSFIADAMRTIESVVLLRGKVEQLDTELAATNRDVKQVAALMIQIDRRLVRLETFEEVRSGRAPLPRIEDRS